MGGGGEAEKFLFWEHEDKYNKYGFIWGGCPQINFGEGGNLMISFFMGRGGSEKTI